VWEPILPTDWSAPGGAILARISDARAQQFYDPKHVVSEALDGIVANKHEPEPHCCKRKNFYWDDAVLYKSQARWGDAPTSAFWDGPVDRVIPSLETTIAQQAVR
jgi:hypothetical protein